MTRNSETRLRVQGINTFLDSVQEPSVVKEHPGRVRRAERVQHPLMARRLLPDVQECPDLERVHIHVTTGTRSHTIRTVHHHVMLHLHLHLLLRRPLRLHRVFRRVVKGVVNRQVSTNV